MVFKEEDFERADWELLRHGAVTLFWDPKLYQRAVKSLQKLNYNVLAFEYDQRSDFCEAVSEALKWEAQFGYSPWNGNLNAFNDGLRGEPCESSVDSAICIENFHNCVRENAGWAEAFLDILESHSRDYLLTGKRLIILIQTDEADYFCEKLGGRRAQWNRAEWMNKDRGIK